ARTGDPAGDLLGVVLIGMQHQVGSALARAQSAAGGETAMRVPLTIGDFLSRGAAVYGPRRAVIDEPGTAWSLGTLTYAGLVSRAGGMAVVFGGLGVAHGERVAIVSPNAARFQISYFGVSAFGRVLVPVNYRLNAEEIRYIIDPSGTSVLLVDPESDEALR